MSETDRTVNAGKDVGFSGYVPVTRLGPPPQGEPLLAQQLHATSSTQQQQAQSQQQPTAQAQPVPQQGGQTP